MGKGPLVPNALEKFKFYIKCFKKGYTSKPKTNVQKLGFQRKGPHKLVHNMATTKQRVLQLCSF
jgi:hypothetical protein